MTNDSTKKTLFVAIAVCLVCSVIVSAAAVSLRPQQITNKLLDKQRNILNVVDLLEEGSDIQALYDQHIEASVVDLKTGEYITDTDANTFDQKIAASDPALSMELGRDTDIAGIGRRANQASVYLVRDENGDVKYYILPVHGYGLWSTMYGFLALEADANTVYGISFYSHAETPGLGGEIDNPNWQQLWRGKKIYDENGAATLALIKGSVDTANANATYQVDGLAGATLTSRGVSNMIKFWLGANGFNTFLTNEQARG